MGFNIFKEIGNLTEAVVNPFGVFDGAADAVNDTFLGGAERDAARKQAESGRTAQGQIQAGVNEARGDISRLFPQAQQDLNKGFGGAMGVFGSMLPQQSNIYQQGNVAAQEQLLAGLPQIQAALLGGNIDYSALQPTQLQQPDYGSMIPDFSSLFGGGNNFTPTSPNSPALNPALNEGPQQFMPMNSNNPALSSALSEGPQLSQQPRQYFNRTSALTGNPTIDSYAARSRNERNY